MADRIKKLFFREQNQITSEKPLEPCKYWL